MGANQCKQCDIDQTQIEFQNRKPKRTVKDIEDHLVLYGNKHSLAFYSMRQRRAIEQLFQLDQVHISDLIVKLHTTKQDLLMNKLLDQVQSVQLQEIDHMFFYIANTGHVLDNVKVSQESTIPFDEKSSYSLQVAKKISLKKHGSKKKDQEMQIINKYTDNQYEALKQVGLVKIRSNGVVLIATIECFDGIGCLSPTNLPTKKSLFQLFLEKMQTFNAKHNLILPVVFIINPLFEEIFQKKIEKYLDNSSNLQDEESIDMLTNEKIKFHKILYSPIYPCLDHQGQILIKNQCELAFNYRTGDLIGFLQKNNSAQIIIQKYTYSHYVNINNILERSSDQYSVGYLQKHKQINMVSKAIENPHFKSQTTLTSKNGFIEKQHFFEKNQNVTSYKFTKSYVFRNAQFLLSGKNQLNLLTKRIKLNILNSTSFNFERNFEDIQQESATVLVLINQKNQFEESQNKQIEYSNYCKKVLGLKGTNSGELVEICPQVLYGGDKEYLQKIMTALRVSNVGFPIVINRQKVQLK